MKSTRLFASALFLSFSCGLVPSALAADAAAVYGSAAGAAVYGTMMVSKGDIKVISGKGGKTEAGKVGLRVYSGDAIVSGADSRAKIIMSDKNVLNISPDSKVTIEKYENNPAANTRNVELKVDYGKVRASVNQAYDGENNKFNVRTPTAVAGVRGTDFIASFDQPSRSTQVVTFSGVVAVGTAGPSGTIVNPVFVQPGQQTSVNEGAKAAAPVAVPKEKMKSMDTESNADKAAVNAPKADASASDSKGDAKKDAKNDSKSSDKKDASGDRQPASTSTAVVASPSSMIDAKDMDLSVSKDIKVNDTPKAPVMVTPVITSPVVAPVQNTFIDNAVKNQKSRVKIDISLPN